MALEFIVKTKIDGKKMILPRQPLNGEVLKYELDFNNKEIRFFYASKEGDFALNTWEAPKAAREMEFEVYNHNGLCSFGAPVFYDAKGNLLKIGNR